jgi:hypothetical protein
MQDGKVIPLLLDLDKKEISGPLAQFQAKKVEQNEVKELILSLNKSATNPIADGTLEKLFQMAWPEIAAKVAAIPEIKDAPKPARPEGEILEELVAGIRNLETRLASTKEMEVREIEMRTMMHREELEWRSRKARRPLEGELMQIFQRAGSGRADPLQILVAASLVRDDAPWIYELATEVYRALNSGDRIEARRHHRRLMEALNALQARPPASASDPDWKMFYRIFDRYTPQIDPSEEGKDTSEPEEDAALQEMRERIESRRQRKGISG